MPHKRVRLGVWVLYCGQVMLYKLVLLAALLAVAFTCHSSGSCGCCGCRAKARARAAKTNRIISDDLLDDKEDGNIFGLSIWNATNLPTDSESQSRHQNPNYLFHRCCEERHLPKSCIQQCHFNAYNRDVLKSIYLGNHECPIDYLPEMQFCAAQGRDHRQCCSERGVSNTIAGGKCLTFCDQRPDLYTPIDFSYAPCLDRFEDMKRCFYEEVRTLAQKRFGEKKNHKLSANLDEGNSFVL